MKIAIGTDHRGRDMLRHISQFLRVRQHELIDLSPTCNHSVDYPDVAYDVAKRVSRGQVDRGILLCGSGIGMAIAANKVRDIRAALVYDEISAEMSRRHNDANILCLPSELVGRRLIDRVVEIFLQTDFEGGRHTRRIHKISQIERNENAEIITAAMQVKPAQPVAASASPPKEPAAAKLQMRPAQH